MHLLAFDHAGLTAIVADFEQEIETLPERPSHVHAVPFRQSLELDRVSLTYPGGTQVLHDLSLLINRGDKIAIVGKTGVGKTSLLNILLGLVQPTSGRVLFDEVEIAPLTRLRVTNMAYVQQDVFLLDGTIAENVAFATAAEDIDVARLWDSLRCAHLDEKIRNIANGVNARIGENGIGLSGGERQRLALARAFYECPSFLVLDEATSQLDLSTERAILTDLLVRHPEITLVMVTHRAVATTQFDRCLKVEKGTIVEFDRDLEKVAAAGTRD
jgi:ABC-type multidrug transport system fused ATPase/permease subunit